MIERSRTGIVDVLDHVLDKGIIIDAWVNVALVGIELVTVEARVVVASIQTFLQYAATMSQLDQVSRRGRPDRRSRATADWQLRSDSETVSERRAHMMRRRLEDRVLDELHDTQARTVGPASSTRVRKVRTR